MAVINWKKYLPSSMRATRWGEFIEVVQSVAFDIKEDQIDRLKLRFDFDEMTEDDLKYFLNFFGHNLSEYEGYTSSIEYLKRQFLTIIPRITNKTNRVSYENLRKIYLLSGEVYPMYNVSLIELAPILGWWTSDEEVSTILTLDAGEPNIISFNFSLFDRGTEFDKGGKWDTKFPVYDLPPIPETSNETLDSDTGLFETLDQVDTIAEKTRHLLLNYGFYFIEEEDTFLSMNTARAIYNDSQQLNLKTENLYYEPLLTLIGYESADPEQILETEYTNEFDTLSSLIKAVSFSGDLTDVITIKIGDGTYTDGELPTITDLNSITHTLNLKQYFNTYNQTTTELNCNYRIQEYNKVFEKITEIGLFDVSGNILFYFLIPEIHYYEKMYSSIKLDISLITS